MQKLDYKIDQLNPAEIAAAKIKLENLGMLSEFCGGIQLDVMVARAKIHDQFKDAGFCDHNCQIETNGVHTGSYNCNIAKSVRPGEISIKSLAGAGDILFGLGNAIEGMQSFNFDFTHSYIGQIAQMANLSQVEVAAYLQNLKKNKIILNLFGGNPELHPQIFEIISGAQSMGLHVNLTTTGGMFMIDKFANNFLANPTDIALSADDFDGPNHIFKLMDALKEPESYRKTWLTIPAQYGQKRKALEAVYAANLIQQSGATTEVLFNLVIHPGNIAYVDQQIESIINVFPNAQVNPFPAQDAFYNGQPSFKIEDLPMWEKIIDGMLLATIEGKSGIIKKLHYWMLLKAAFIVYKNNPQRLLEFLGGFNSWNCYSDKPGAGRFLQIGGSPELTTNTSYAGGHLNCFWNDSTIYNDRDQVSLLTPSQISNHITSGMNSVAQHAVNPCGGCLFPRLNALDELVLVAGMNNELLDEYVKLREFIWKTI